MRRTHRSTPGSSYVHSLGVRTFFPIHEFDNAFGGTKGIAGGQGELVNAGNRLETGSFMTMQPCPAEDQDAEQESVPAAGPLAQVLNGPWLIAAGREPGPGLRARAAMQCRAGSPAWAITSSSR